MDTATVAGGEGSSRVAAVRLTLRGRQLQVAWALWTAVTALTIGLTAASLPAGFAYLRSVCAGRDCSPQLTSEAAHQLLAHGLSPDVYAVYLLAVITLFEAGSCLIAALLVWRRRDELMVLFVSLMLVTGACSAPPPLGALASSAPQWRWLIESVQLLGHVLPLLFLYLFPSGRFVPSWTKLLAAVVVAWEALILLEPQWPINPDAGGAGLLLFFGFFAVGVYAQIYRYRRVSDHVERQQTKWVVFGVSLSILGFLGAVFLFAVAIPGALQRSALANFTSETLAYALLFLIPLSLAIAVSRSRLWDIDFLINRAAVYGALSAGIVAVYVLVVAGLGSLLQARGSLLLSLVATGAVAVLFGPLRERLRRGVNRLMYGERDDPYSVISHLGQRLEETMASQAILPTVVETVAQSLKLPYVAIAQGAPGTQFITAQWGQPVAEPLRFPLLHQGEAVGELLLAPRTGETRLSPADRRLLDELARQAGVAVHAVRLAAALQAARERLVTAQEEERRRLRRDLHDGLGPMLGSLTLKLDVADDLVERDPGAVHTILRDLKSQTQTAIADIRRLVYALRPPALDELGLVAALREAAASYQGGNDDRAGVRITVEAPDDLPPFAAAVEVAAYRIVQEALANVVRHAGARRCAARLEVDPAAGGVCIEVVDDGRGLPTAYRAGVGLTSMRERAEELGGSLRVESAAAGGTRVRAFLPCSLSGEVKQSGTHSGVVGGANT